MFKRLFFILFFASLCSVPCEAITRSKAIFCLRSLLASITLNEHRPLSWVHRVRAHILRNGSQYKNATFKEQVDYVVEHIQGLDRAEAESILSTVFTHPNADAHVRVVFGGSRVRGNAHVGSDLDVGAFGFGKNRLESLIKKVNKKVEQGEFKIPLETTKIFENNQTENIPIILSPEEFFLRTGRRAHTEEELKEFTPSGFISVGKDGTIIHVPPPSFH